MNTCERTGNNHRATCGLLDDQENLRYEALLAIETGLKSSMLSRTAFSIVLVNDEGPWLVTSLEALRDGRNCICRVLGRVMIMIIGNIHVATFVVDCLLP